MPTILNPTLSGVNSAQASWVANYPAYNNGDLVLIQTANDDSTDVTGVTAPAGPNAEVLTRMADQLTGGDATPPQRMSAWWYIATSTQIAGTLTFTPSASEQWGSIVARVATGDFDAATPIGASQAGGNSVSSTTSRMAAFTAGATDGGGTLCAFGGINAFSLNTTPLTGWNYSANQDIGTVGNYLAVRTASVTNSESIANADFDLISTQSDQSSTFGFIVRAAASSAMMNRMMQEGYNA